MEPASPRREVKSPIKKSKTMKKRLTFNIPYTGIDHPFIDGEGVSSLGREGAGAKKYPYIAEKMNEHDPIYPNGKTFLSATTRGFNSASKKDSYKLNKIVYDCLSSSPFYQVKEYYSTYNRIVHDRRPFNSVSA